MMKDTSIDILSSLTIYMKYARHIHEISRRETWDELCDRNVAMHIKRYPQLKEEIKQVYKDFVRTKKVLPSMRSLQFGGQPIELSESRIFNCAFMPLDHPAAFSEAMFLLLGGTGVGYSVQARHVNKLPSLTEPAPGTYRFLVGDSIEGWADAVKILLKAYFQGKALPRFDFSGIRPKGARLITSGGKAPGPKPLKDCLDRLQAVLERALLRGTGTRLRPIEAHDMLCHIADAVLAGGIRRAAMIVLFDRADQEMLTCKSNLACTLQRTDLVNQEQELYECDIVTTMNGKEYHNVILHSSQLAEWKDKGALPWYLFEPQRGRANNSANLLRGAVSETEFRDLMKIVELSGAGEPGVYWTNNLDWGTNPCCVSGDTWVMTDTGAHKASDLVGKDFNVFVDGQLYPANAGGFWLTGTKPVFKLTTKRGHEVKLTADHRIKRVSYKSRKVQKFEWAELQDIEPGESILLSQHSGAIWGSDTPDQTAKGYVLGSLVGDGTFMGRPGKSPVACLDFWGEDASVVATATLSFVKGACEHRADLGVTKQASNCGTKVRIASAGLAELAAEYGIAKGCKTITEAVERTSSAFHASFLRGLFDADGSIQGTQAKGVSVRLTQSNLDLLKSAQRMLLRLGINSTIYSGRAPAGYRNLPDGNGGIKPSWCEEVHELVISGSNVAEYAKRVSFMQPAKQMRLEDVLSGYKRELNRDWFDDEVASIELVGEEPVYDVTVPGAHEFCANGIQAHNCEIGLRPNQFCNLTEINADDITDQDDLEARAGAAAFIGTLQAGYTDFHYLRPVWRETTEADALIGVGITGIGSGAILPLDLEAAARVVKSVNAYVASKIGINPAARTSTVKPAGTTSLVLGSASGIHAWHAPYYVRRVRVGKNEAIYKYLAENHPELVQDEYFRPMDQAVITVPQKAPEGAILRSESPADLLDRVRRFNLEWVRAGHRDGDNTHNVSCTISVKDDEWGIVTDWMWENRQHFNGISVLPYDGGTYIQAPFEDITEEQYNALIGTLSEVDLSRVIESDDNTNLTGEIACGAGGCEVK